MMKKIRDTIPRLQLLVPHMREQMIGLRRGATFEEARLRYSTTVDRLFAEGDGRRTVSRIGDKDKYWSPTGEVLDEAMRMGFVERQPLPSARRYLDAHRGRRYTLTALGEQVADLAEKDLAAFCNELAKAVYQEHEYFRRLLQILDSGPLLCPEVTEGGSGGIAAHGKADRILDRLRCRAIDSRDWQSGARDEAYQRHSSLLRSSAVRAWAR